jgi:hypothetical protein
MSQKFWYKLYFYILLLEYKLDIDQVIYEKYVTSLTETALNYDLATSYEELNNIYKNHEKTNTKKFTFTF